MDIRLKGPLLRRFDWRTKYRLGFAHYGVHRYFRIGKLGIQLWRIR